LKKVDQWIAALNETIDEWNKQVGQRNNKKKHPFPIHKNRDGRPFHDRHSGSVSDPQNSI
jgi:hypothetical protein